MAHVSRREGMLAAVCWADVLSAQAPGPQLAWFDATAAAEIKAVAGEIIPETDTPGADRAGVIWFIDAAYGNVPAAVEISGHATCLAVEQNSISLDKNVKDAWGLPALRVTFKNHPDDMKKYSSSSSGKRRFWWPRGPGKYGSTRPAWKRPPIRGISWGPAGWATIPARAS